MQYLLGVFYQRSEHRLRAPWRLLIQVILVFLGLGVLNLLALLILVIPLLLTGQIPLNGLGNGSALTQDINAAFHQLPLLVGARSLVSLLLVILIYRGLARWIDRRPWQDYGFHFKPGWWRDLGFGLLLGIALMGMIFGAEYALGWVTVSRMLENSQPQLPFWQLLVDGFLAYVLVGVEEELFARGYLIKNLAEGLNLPPIGATAAVLIAYLLTSIFFGFLHGNNANATLGSSLNLVLAGLFLGLGFILTGELAIPIGVHIAWNFFQGYVFGFTVSGVNEHLSLIAAQQSGPALWTGGAFGPEGGLIGILAMLLGILLIYGWVRWTRRRVAVCADLGRYAPFRRSEMTVNLVT
jgi:membrane protease YdiL (CAAX protease family)